MIIDATDFTDRPYKVPNQEESRDFTSFIESKEEELGRMILGNDLYDEFIDALAGSGSLDQIYVDLRDGASYTHNNKAYRYRGWVDMIRPGIFSEWLPNLTYKLTNIGYVENNAPDKSDLIEDQYEFRVLHWNNFVRKVGPHVRNGYTCVDSFYGFMLANEESYQAWEFTCPKYKNRYDL